jgi:putative ABC transport system substrate-binding protein
MQQKGENVGGRAHHVAQDRRLAENRRGAQRADDNSMMITRAALAVVLTLALLAAPLAAQEPGRIYRLGILSPAAVPDPLVATSPNSVPLVLGELGYIAGRNLVVERRFAKGKNDQLRGLARELVQLRVDVIVAVSDDAIQAAKDATATIPIVMGFGNSPVERGFAASLAHPAGNITGVRYEGSGEGQLTGKRLELIKETIPRAARIAVLATGESGSRAQLQAAQKVAPVLGVKLIVVEAQGTDYEHAFATMVAERADALFVVSSTILNSDRKKIIERAAK